MALLSKSVMGFIYGMGAAVVIVGALFKLMHWPGATIMLIIGLSTEAIIFGLSAFEPVEHELDWTLVYPELAGGEPRENASNNSEVREAQGLLSKKIDEMLKEAKIDAELMNSLGKSIRNFEEASKSISPTIDSIAVTKKYTEELSLASIQMESLNGLYKLQLESASRNTEVNNEISEKAGKLKEQIQSMTSHIASLNTVYGGMLSAMNNNRG